MLITERAVTPHITIARLLAYAALSVAYVVTGKLAMLLAAPPGYASPIFPPAGIAVGAMLIDGAATLPWTFLGSFGLNLWIGYSVDRQFAMTGFAGALLIAAASTLQAAVAGGALRRKMGYPAPLDNARDLARFLLLSPLCCLLSASFSVAGLAALAIVQAADFATSWVSWWIGDTLGVLVVLPMMLVVAGEPRTLWRSRARSVALPMLLFFTLFAVIFVRVSSWERDDSLLEFRVLSQQAVDKIKSGLEQQSVFLEQLERAFTRQTPLPRADFRHLVGRLRERFPMIQAAEWAPRIDAAARAAFEAAQREDLPGFEIREVDPGGLSRRAGERDRYYPVTYVEPHAGNEQAVGFDLASNPKRMAALARSEATGAIAATKPVRLVQETGGQAGILLLVAVPGGGDGPGVVLTVLRMGDFIEGLLTPMESSILVRLVDEDQRGALFDTVSPTSAAPRYEQAFDFGGRSYRVATAPTAAYLRRYQHWQSWAVLVAGVLSTGLLGALLMLGTGYTRRIETVVEQRTRDLESANRRLQQEIEERRQAEAALRQAQRMEAIGQLTGGIAHDFNNLLMVVLGNAAMLRDSAKDETSARRAGAILRAAERGERLTRQLLAFSRRQTLRPDAADLRQRAGDIAELLARSLRDDIELVVDIPGDLWPVAVDQAEFELALLNIGVNARDAMPNGGRFRLAARNVGPQEAAGDGLSGDFVALTLSDTGAGMTQEVRARAFEPYFTTKEIGIGSGLGLSQVYGFAKQSGGDAVIDSTPGAGATVTLYLPRAAAAAIPEPVSPQTPAAPAELRILLVEDDPEVADATAELLDSTGMEVVRADSGEAALAVAERDPAIDLVLSDVVMPGGISGLDLAHALRRQRPALPILLATGYSRYGAQAIGDGFAMIEKPFGREALLAAIHNVIAGTRRERAR